MPKKGTKRRLSGTGNDLDDSTSKRKRGSSKSVLEKPDTFKELLTKAGFQLPIEGSNNTLNVDQAVFQKNLKRLINKYDKEQIIEEFLCGLQTYIEDLERFRYTLLPTLSSAECPSIRSGNQDSLIHLLLGVDAIQKPLVTILLEKLPELEDDDSNIGMLVLNQFRWLDKVTDSKMLVTKIFEVLQVTSQNFQSHLISTLPEIIEDDQNNEVATYLQELLLQNDQLTVPIIDALSNMQLDADQLQEAQNAAINILESASTENLAVIVRFILQSVAPTTAVNVISLLRSHLDLQCSMVPLTSSTPGRRSNARNDYNLSGVTQKVNSDGFLILDTINRVLRFNSVVANGFIKVIGDVETADGHMVLDLYVMVMMYSNQSYKKSVVTMLSKKIRSDQVTIPLLQTAFVSYTQVFKDHIGSVISLAEYMIKSKDAAMCMFATSLLQLTFLSLDMFCRQEVIGLLVSHVGGGIQEMTNTCLNILKNLVQEDVDRVEPFSAFIKGILDYIDNLSHHHIRLLFSILSILGFNKKQQTNLIQDDLHIFIRKQLSSDKEMYKKIGVVGAVEILNTLASTRQKQDTIKDGQTGEIELTDEAFKQITGLMELVKKNCYGMPQVTAMFYDELATVILKSNLNPKVQSWIDEEIANEFQDKYVTDMDVGTVGKENESFLSNGMFYSLEREGSLAGIAIDIMKLTEAMTVPANTGGDLESPTCAVCLTPLFRLLKSCEEVRNGNLDDIDALLGCPVKTINIDSLQKPETYPLAERKKICACLFNTINWFREMLNAFASHSDPDLRIKVIERLANIIKLQHVLHSFLAVSPEFKPPTPELNLEFGSTINEVAIKVKTKPVSSKKQQKEDQSQLTLNEDASVSQAADQSVNVKKAPAKKVLTNSIDQFKIYYRDLDVTVFSIFTWAAISNSFGENQTEAKEQGSETKVSPEQVVFLLEDLHCKLNQSLKPKHKLIKPTKILNSHSHLAVVSAQSIIEQVVNLTPVLCLHLENSSVFFQSLESEDNDIDDSYLPSANSDHMKACYSLVLQVLMSITSWNGFTDDANEELLERFFVPIYNRVHTASEVKLTIQQLLRESFVYLENFSNSVPNLSCAVLLVKLLISIESRAKLPDLRTRLGNLGKTLLQKKWSLVDCEMMSKRSELIQQLLRTYVTYSEDRFECLSTLTSTGMSELIDSEGRPGSESYPLLTKQSFGCFFRNILCELVQGIKRIKSSVFTDAQVNVSIMLQWNAAIKVLHMLTKLIKIFTAKPNISALLKQGQKFVDIFLRSGMPILDKVFRLKKEEVLNLLKTLQHSTRMLHHICSHSKSVGDVALTAHVPPMKRSLESFVYRVKVMLTLHNCQDAFWIGNLKNRDLQGAEILSQRPPSPSESENVDQGDEDDAKSDQEEEEGSKGEEYVDDQEGSSKDDNKSDELISSDDDDDEC